MLLSKCRTNLLCVLLLLALLLSACDPQSVSDPTQSENSGDPQVLAPIGEPANFTMENRYGVSAVFGGLCPASTVDGCYKVAGGRVSFYDTAAGRSAILCAQPGCSHSDETCRAWLGTASIFTEYNGQIYATRSVDKGVQVIRKDLTSGAITVLAEWKDTDTVSYEPQGIMIANGKGWPPYRATPAGKRVSDTK